MIEVSEEHGEACVPLTTFCFEALGEEKFILHFRVSKYN